MAFLPCNPSIGKSRAVDSVVRMKLCHQLRALSDVIQTHADNLVVALGVGIYHRLAPSANEVQFECGPLDSMSLFVCKGVANALGGKGDLRPLQALRRQQR